MFTLLNYCRRYHGDWYDGNDDDNDDAEGHDQRILRQQTESMTIETRQSLTQKIVETLNEGIVAGGGTQGDDNNNNNEVVDDEREVNDTTNSSNNNKHHITTTNSGGGEGENVEAILEKVERDLIFAQQRLVTLEDKERFLAVRIAKYKSLLQEQTERLQKTSKPTTTTTTTTTTTENNDDDNDNNSNDNNQRDDGDAAVDVEELHHQEQVAKFEKHKEGLMKIIDIHLDILKNIKNCKRTIDYLEAKKIDLLSTIKKCRQFLIVSSELEREQQLGIITDDNVDADADDQEDTTDLHLMEMAPMIKNANANEEEGEYRKQQQQQSEEEEENNNVTATPPTPRPHCPRSEEEEEEHLVDDEETGLRQEEEESTGLLFLSQQQQQQQNTTSESTSSSNIGKVGLDLTTDDDDDNRERSNPPTNVEPLELTV